MLLCQSGAISAKNLKAPKKQLDDIYENEVVKFPEKLLTFRVNYRCHLVDAGWRCALQAGGGQLFLSRLCILFFMERGYTYLQRIPELYI